MSRAWRRARRHKGIWVGGALILVWVVLAALATTLTGYSPDDVDINAQLDYQNVPPYWLTSARWAAGHELPPGAAPRRFLCGTDDSGNDILARVLHGARYSLTIGFVAVGIAVALGVPLGLLAGYFGGRLDGAIMRALDVVMAFPTILLAIGIVTVLGQSLLNLMIAVGLVGVPSIARQLRAQVLVVRELEYVQAARALGAGHLRILLHHVLPNCMAPIIVLATLGTATAILETAGLGFVGLGPEPGTPEWGLMISENRNLISRAPWAVITPGAAIVLLVLGFNLVGDGLRDVLDPRSKT